MLIIWFSAPSHLFLAVSTLGLFIIFVMELVLTSVWVFCSSPFHLTMPFYNFIFEVLFYWVDILTFSNSTILLREFLCLVFFTWLYHNLYVNTTFYDTECFSSCHGNCFMITLHNCLDLLLVLYNMDSTTLWLNAPWQSITWDTLSSSKTVSLSAYCTLIFKNQVIPILFTQCKLQRKIDSLQIHFIKFA